MTDFYVKTPRLLLRLPTIADVPFYTHTFSDPANIAHEPFPTPTAREQITTLLTSWLARIDTRDSAQLVVCLDKDDDNDDDNNENTPIGLSGVNCFVESDGGIYADIGILIDEPLTKQGYAREAFCAVVEWCLDIDGAGGTTAGSTTTTTTTTKNGKVEWSHSFKDFSGKEMAGVYCACLAENQLFRRFIGKLGFEGEEWDADVGREVRFYISREDWMNRKET